MVLLKLKKKQTKNSNMKKTDEMKTFTESQKTISKPPLPPATTVPAAPMSSISTYYGGLEARNVETGEVKIVRSGDELDTTTSNERKSTPAKIDVCSSSPPNSSRRLVDRRSEQVKAQYERIVTETRRPQSSESDEQEMAVEDGGDEPDHEVDADDDSLDDERAVPTVSDMRRQKSESSASDSMDRFERPSKFELQKLQHEKMLAAQQQKFQLQQLHQQSKSAENTSTDDLLKVYWFSFVKFLAFRCVAFRMH